MSPDIRHSIVARPPPAFKRLTVAVCSLPAFSSMSIFPGGGTSSAMSWIGCGRPPLFRYAPIDTSLPFSAALRFFAKPPRSGGYICHSMKNPFLTIFLRVSAGFVRFFSFLAVFRTIFTTNEYPSPAHRRSGDSFHAIPRRTDSGIGPAPTWLRMPLALGAG